MLHACPVSHTSIDSRIVRLTALQVTILGILLLYFNHIAFGWILLFDFLMRASGIKNLSPLRHTSILITKMIKMDQKPCDEAPKRFATYLGLLFMVFIVCFLLFTFIFPAKIFTIGLVSCAALEAFFDYCVGCKVYHYISHIKSLS